MYLSVVTCLPCRIVYLSSDMWMIVYLSVVTCLPMEDSVSECSDMSTRGG